MARHAAGPSRPGSGRQPRQLVIAALTASVENAAEVTLQAIDDRRQTLGIDNVKVSFPPKLASCILEALEPV